MKAGAAGTTSFSRLRAAAPSRGSLGRAGAALMVKGEEGNRVKYKPLAYRDFLTLARERSELSQQQIADDKTLLIKIGRAARA